MKTKVDHEISKLLNETKNLERDEYEQYVSEEGFETFVFIYSSEYNIPE
jgi:hypothetical protein